MQRILIIKLGALGDVIMATALVEAICRHHAQDRVTVLTSPRFATLFGERENLNVHGMDRHGLRNTLAMLQYLRRGRFRRVYDLQSNDRTRWLCALASIPERVGNHTHWPYTLHPAQPWDRDEHIFKRYCRVLESAEVPVSATLPQVPASTETQQFIADWREAVGLTRTPFCILHAGASALRPLKRWPRFAELARVLRARGLEVVWIGGPEEHELNQRLSAAGGIDATAAFDITGLTELGRHARFAVTNDSGPMHALAASGIAVFGLFGPSDWRRNHALGQREHVLTGPGYDGDLTARNGANGLDLLSAETVVERLSNAGLLTA